jgi:hypothetical protein
VLRTRPDVLLDTRMIGELCAADMSLAPEDVVPGGLDHKIWVPFVELCQPMCMSDIVFFGHAADIARLQTFDMFHEVAHTHLQLTASTRTITSYDAEVRKYAPPFIPAYPILGEYLRLYNRFFLGVHELRRSMLGVLYREEAYWRYMAAYLDALRRYVRVGHDLIEGQVFLVRPESPEQTSSLCCLELMTSDYADQAIAAGPDAATTIELFAAAPVYASSSAAVARIAAHLDGIGARLAERLAQAKVYRKDEARIAAFHDLRERLTRAIYAGLEMDRPKVSAWHHPFAVRFLDLG